MFSLGIKGTVSMEQSQGKSTDRFHLPTPSAEASLWPLLSQDTWPKPRSILDGLILTSLLVSMGISTFTSKEIILFAGYLADWQWDTGGGWTRGVLFILDPNPQGQAVHHTWFFQKPTMELSTGDTLFLWLKLMETPDLKWMMTGGTPMT